jgi:hypothetical protein
MPTSVRGARRTIKKTGARRQDSGAATVRRQLEQYAERGVFRSFSHISSTAGKSEYRFSWLWNQPFHFSFDEKRKTLTFRKLLPNLPVGSQIETAVRAFLDDLASPQRPEHRRLDPARIVIRYSNQRGTASLAFRVQDTNFEFAVQRAMDVVNELFLMFLNATYPEYLVETFGLPEE